MPFLSTFLLGSFTTIFTLQFLKITSKILPYYTSSTKFIKKNQKNEIKRIAIILGGTDGIGKEYARFLNNHNYQIVLVSRNKQKIMDIFQLINKNNPIKVNQKDQNLHEKYLLVDFSKIDLKQTNSLLMDFSQKLIKENIENEKISIFKKYQIGIINCVGEAHVSRYEDIPLSQISKFNSVNINSFHFGLNIVKLLKEQLVKKGIQNQFFFVNISSAVGQYPNPYSSIYSACKAYQSNLMKVLNLQRINSNSDKNNKIVYLNIKPYYVSTKMIKFMKSWDTAEPIDIVQGTFKVLQKKQEAAGCVKHEILFCLSYLVNLLIKQRPKKALEVTDRLVLLKKKSKDKNRGSN